MPRDLLEEGQPKDLLAPEYQESAPAAGKKTYPGYLPKKVQEFGAGAARGMIETAAGPVQLGADLLGLLATKVGASDPGLGGAFTKAINDWRRANEETYPEGGTLMGASLKDVGEFAGNIAPLAAIPAAPVAGTLGRIAAASATGSAIGGASFAPQEDVQGRIDQKLTNTIVGGLAGTAGGAAAEGIGAVATKVANTSAVREMVKGLKEFVDQYDPGLNVARKSLDKTVEQSEHKLTVARSRENTMGDRLVPDVDTSQLSQSTIGALGKLKGSVDPDSRVMGVLKRLDAKLNPQESQGISQALEEIAQLGPQFQKSVTTQYMSQLKPPTALSYSDLRGVSEDITLLLQEKGSKAVGDKSWQILKEAKDAVDSELTAIHKKYPDLRRLATAASKAEDTLRPMLGPELKALREGSAYERGEALKSIALSKDSELAELGAKMIGKRGQADAEKFILKTAMDRAVDKKGHFDPAHFSKFLDDHRDSLKPFMGPEAMKSADGLQNLLSEHSRRTGKTVADAGVLKRGIPPIGIAGGMGASLATGDIKYAGVAIGMQVMWRLSDKMLETSAGRAFLAAAAKAKPGTPEAARVFDASVKRFMPMIMAEEQANPGLE